MHSCSGSSSRALAETLSQQVPPLKTIAAGCRNSRLVVSAQTVDATVPWAVADPDKDGDIIADGDSPNLDILDGLRYRIASYEYSAPKPAGERIKERLVPHRLLARTDSPRARLLKWRSGKADQVFRFILAPNITKAGRESAGAEPTPVCFFGGQTENSPRPTAPFLCSSGLMQRSGERRIPLHKSRRLGQTRGEYTTATDGPPGAFPNYRFNSTSIMSIG